MTKPEQFSSGWECNHIALRKDEALISTAIALSLVDDSVGFDIATVSNNLAIVGYKHGASPDDIQAALEFHEPNLCAYGPIRWDEEHE